MYTAKIIEKKISIQEEFLLLTVQLESDVAVTPVVDPNKEPKLDKDGNIKPPKVPKPRFPTKEVFFKFALPVTETDINKAIKDKAKMIADTEALNLPLNTVIT